MGYPYFRVHANLATQRCQEIREDGATDRFGHRTGDPLGRRPSIYHGPGHAISRRRSVYRGAGRSMTAAEFGYSGSYPEAPAIEELPQTAVNSVRQSGIVFGRERRTIGTKVRRTLRPHRGLSQKQGRRPRLVPKPTPQVLARKPPRLLDDVAQAAGPRGPSELASAQLLLGVRAYVLFLGKRHPSEPGLPAVTRFLEHLVRAEKQPLLALESARSALELLYGTVLGIDLGVLPRPRPTRLLDQMCLVLRVRHYAPRTEACYLHWARQFMRFHARRHLPDLGAAEVEQFQTHLAVDGRVSARTQNQAALVFVYAQVLKIDLGGFEAVRACQLAEQGGGGGEQPGLCPQGQRDPRFGVHQARLVGQHGARNARRAATASTVSGRVIGRSGGCLRGLREAARLGAAAWPALLQPPV